MKYRWKKHVVWLITFVLVSEILFNGGLSVYATDTTYSLTVDSRSNVSGEISLSVHSAKAGDEVKITATPKDESVMRDGIVITKQDKTDNISMNAVSALSGTDSMSNLFDNNAATSWSCNVPARDKEDNTDDIYIIFKAPAKFVATDYELDGVEVSKWQSFFLYGGNFTANDETGLSNKTKGWSEIKPSPIELYDDDNQTVISGKDKGTLDNFNGYQYYMIKVCESSNATTVQMKGIKLSGYEVVSTIETNHDTSEYTYSMPACNGMVMAHFVTKPKLSYHLNEGTGTAPAASYCVPGTKVKVAAGTGFSHPGYAFKGWTRFEPDGNDGFKLYQKDDEITVDEDVVLYAYWEEKTSPFTGITVTGYDGEYDGTNHSIMVSGGNGITVKYSNTGAENTYTLDNPPEYRNAGEYVSYYELSKDGEKEYGSVAVTISKRPVSIFVSNLTKNYGEADPAIGQSNCELVGTLATGDRIDTIPLTRQSGEKVGIYAYDPKSADVVIKNGSTNVNDNYDITFSADCTLSINKKVVTISGITASSKTYNGTTDAALDFSGAKNWAVEGDQVGVTAFGAFADKNAGTDKLVTISDLALTGEDKDNYELASSGQQGSCMADINRKPVIVNGIAAENKVFDDTDTATLSYKGVTFTGTDGKNAIIGDDVLSVEATGRFEDKALGKDKTVHISNLTLTGADAGNYILADSSDQQSDCIASIVSSAIKVSGIKAKKKEYDGTNDAELDCSAMTVEGIKDGDDVTVTAAGKFIDKNVGNQKQVAISYVLSGNDAANYAISSSASEAQRSATASITKKEVTVSGISVAQKVYDGTTDATVDYSKASYGKIGEDDFVISSVTGQFDDKSVGDDKIVAISGITFSGADASNYVLKSGAVTETTGSIKPCFVAVNGITVKSKVYDGTTEAELDVTGATIDGKLEEDNLTFTVSGAFADKNAGNNKKVTLLGLTLSGADVGNYVISSNQNDTLSGDITAKEVVVSGIAAKDKNYDGDTEATFTYDGATIVGTDGKDAVIGEDELGIEATGEFEDKNNGKDKTVYIKKITLIGKDAANYVLARSGQQKECKADINGIPVAVSGITAESKTYDGRTNAVLDLSKAILTGVDEGDKVYVSAIGEFEDARAGDGKTVKLRSVQLTGKDAGNYAIVEASQIECKADIKPISVTVSGITAENKAYDGNETATLTFDNVTISGVLKSDKVAVNAKGAFADKYPGTGKDVILSDLTLTGQDAGNYVFAEDGKQEKAAADITLTDGKVTDESFNEDGSKTISEVEYKDGQPTNKVTNVTYDENGVSLIERNTYSDSGELEKSVAFSVNSDREIYQMVVKDAEGNELVCKDDSDVTYGNKEETVEEIMDNLRNAEVTDYQTGSILDSHEISPDEMAFMLKDESLTRELLTDAIRAGEADGATGGANVKVAGFDGALDTSKEEVLKLALTPTEMVQMLASAETTNVVIEFSEEEPSEDHADEKRDAARQKLHELVNEDEDVYLFHCDMYKSVSGSTERTRITEFATAIGTGFSIPESLRKENRSYRLIGSHEDAATGEITANEITLHVDENFHASFTSNKLCLMSLVYTDDDIKARKVSEKEAVQKEAAEKEAAEREAAEKEAAEKEAAEKEAAQKEEAEKEAAEKEAEEKEAARQEVAKKATAMKEVTEKETAAREAAEKETEAKEAAKAEIDKRLVDAKEEIDNNAALDETAKYEVRKRVDAAAASAKNEIENKGSATKKNALESFNNLYQTAVADGKSATDIRIRSTVTSEEMDKNTIRMNDGFRVTQKASKLNIVWSKVEGVENYDVYVQYCGKSFADTPDLTVNSNTTSASIDKAGGKKLNLKKNYKIYVVAYRTVEGKKIVLAKTITAHVVGRKNAVYTNAKSITIKSRKTLKMSEKEVSVIKAKTNLVSKSKKMLTDAHAEEFRYASSDKKVATVSKTGVIKAVGKGTCTIYVYARNGYAKKISVTVK